MSKTHGDFVWYELMTRDTKAAAEFYGAVVGWTSQDTSIPGVNYTTFLTGGHRVAGLMELPEGAPPCWIGYIGADDVDASAGKVAELGGVVHRQPDDIPSIGRFAVVADPHGAVFSLFKGTGEMPQIPQHADGNVGWHELMAGDLTGAWTFYEQMFGWTKDQAIPMGEMGDYQLFANGGNAIGGMMTKLPSIPAPPYWGFYFNVDGLDAAIERATTRGAKVVNGPMEVPGGAWIVNAMDPQGVFFNLVSMTK